MTETGGDTSKLKDYASCQHPPIKIYQEDKANVPILLLFPPAPLHILLGVGNDALKCMDVIWSETGAGYTKIIFTGETHKSLQTK